MDNVTEYMGQESALSFDFDLHSNWSVNLDIIQIGCWHALTFTLLWGNEPLSDFVIAYVNIQVTADQVSARSHLAFYYLHIIIYNYLIILIIIINYLLKI